MTTIYPTHGDTDQSLTIRSYHNALCIEDPRGGVWWPSVPTADVDALRRAFDADDGEWCT